MHCNVAAGAAARLPEMVSGLSENPWPMPISTIGKATPVRYSVSAETPLSQVRPISDKLSPTTSKQPLPNRCISIGTAIAAAKLGSVAGLSGTPGPARTSVSKPLQGATRLAPALAKVQR